MRKQAPVVERMIAENEADWARLQGPTLPESEPVASRRLRLNRSFWSVVALLLLLVSAGRWWWRVDQAALSQPVADVTATAQPARGAIVPGRASVAAFVTDGQAIPSRGQHLAQEGISLSAAGHPAEPDVQLAIGVRTVEVWGERGVAQFVTRTGSRAPAYRQTRFYQRIGPDWRRTAPDATLWGPERSLDTLFVTFHYRQQDVPAVLAVAPQVNNLYTTLQRNLGLPRKAWAEKLVIEVSVTHPPGQTAPRLQGNNRFIVPSPAVYLAPVELTDAELLAQSIVLPLLEHMLAQANEYHAVKADWQLMLNGLYLWQVWDLELPLAAWREDVVKWLYLDLPTSQPGQAVVLPERYDELCAAHTLWLRSPVQLHLPLFCNDLDQTHRFFYGNTSNGPLTRLSQLAVPLHVKEYADKHVGGPDYVYHLKRRVQTIALATLIEYAVATYGRERLPTLLTGLGRYDSWETLLPAVYGVSAAEFEAGWQAYLVAHYGAVSAD